MEPGKNGIEYTFEKEVFEDITYYCFTCDDNRNGEIDEDESAQVYWVKYIDTNEPQEFYYAVANSNEGYYDGLPPKADYLKAADSNDAVARINGNIMTIFTRTSEGELVEQEESFIQYPDGDLHEKKAIGTETATELITGIQDVPTITESGKLTADKGKAFKTVDIGDNFVEKEYFVGELYDDGCGYGYRIKSWPGSIIVKNPNLLNEFHLSDGVTLSRLYDYSSYSYYGYTQDKTPQGRLYLSKVVDRIPCGTEELLIPTHYYLK